MSVSEEEAAEEEGAEAKERSPGGIQAKNKNPTQWCGEKVAPKTNPTKIGASVFRLNALWASHKCWFYGRCLALVRWVLNQQTQVGGTTS